MSIASIIGINVPQNKLVIYRNSETGHFLPGKPAWNKGMKGLQIGGKASQFKPGNVPYNTLSDGAITIRYNKRQNRSERFIRIAKAKWIPLKKYLWEKQNGPVPYKHVLVYKDGDTLNVELSNIELITMAENCKRNYNHEKARTSIKQAWERAKLRKAYGLSPINNGLAVWFCKPTTPLQSNDKLSKAYKLYRLLSVRADFENVIN